MLKSLVAASAALATPGVGNDLHVFEKVWKKDMTLSDET